MVPTIKKKYYNIIQRFDYCLLQKVTVSHITFEIFIYILYATVNNKLLNKE